MEQELAISDMIEPEDSVRSSREERFSTMFRESYAFVLAYSLRRVPHDEAQDVVSETFMTAWRHFDELDRGPVLPWLYRTARNAIANQGRGRARREHLQQRIELSSTAVASDHAEELPNSWAIGEALEAVSPQDAEILRLVAWEGLSTADAAKALGCSPSTFRIRLFRARRRLNDALASPNQEE